MNDTPKIDPLTIEKHGPVTIYHDVEQGSDEWHALRCGLITCSELKLLLTPSLKIADNDKQRTHIYELVAQRITNYTEPTYVSDDMLRGTVDEVDAIMLYSEKIEPPYQVGFITNDAHGFTLGYSPDSLVGKAGAIECKSRRQKYQAKTILEHVATGSATLPSEFALQIQGGLIASGRQWVDFISYCGGMPMVVMRIYPDEVIQAAIIEACQAAEETIRANILKYHTALSHGATRAYPTKRRDHAEDLIL